MGKRSRAESLALNLPQLQNLIKRDAHSYLEEFMIQWRHFESAVLIFNLKPDMPSGEFGDQIMFISQVAPCYPSETKGFPQTVVDMLSNHHQSMVPDLRKTMVQSLILMRNRNLISQTSLLSLFFTLFRCNDKVLRALLHTHIVSDIKNANQKAKNNKLNKTLQNFMYTMLKDSSEIAAKKSLEVMIELYKKNVWDDAKTVNVITEACFSNVPKLVAPAVHFFLGTNENDIDSDDDDEVPNLDGLRHANQVNKKSKSRRNTLDKAMASIKKKDRARNRAEHFHFSALHLVNDPQDNLFARLKQVTQKNIFKFELRLVMINLISRMIGVHQLINLGFYEYLISYLKPHQREVTQILAFLAQSCHELIPPDALESVVKAIADNFIWSNCSPEVITAGLNGLREICTRTPLAMPEELLKSLMDDYKHHRERGPMNAARSLLGLYRDINPEMLKKKDRGKGATMNMKTFTALKYGQVRIADGVDGADLLDNDDLEPLSDFEEVEEDEIPKLISAIDGKEVESDDEEQEEFDDEEELGSDEEIELGSDEEFDEQELSGDEQTEGELTKSPNKKPKVGSATERIFTDEDFARIRELRQERDAEKLAGLKSRRPSANEEDENEFVDVSKIMAGVRRKDDYKARMESIKEGREGRTYGSRKGSEERSSTTNREKAKKTKAFMMIVHKRSVKGKAKASLRDKQRTLRKHITKQKKNM